MGSSDSARDAEKAATSSVATSATAVSKPSNELGTSVKLRMFSSPLVGRDDTDHHDDNAEYPQIKRVCIFTVFSVAAVVADRAQRNN